MARSLRSQPACSRDGIRTDTHQQGLCALRLGLLAQVRLLRVGSATAPGSPRVKNLLVGEQFWLRQVRQVFFCPCA